MSMFPSRRFSKQETELPEMADIRKVEFLAISETSKVIFIHTPSLTEGILTSAFAVSEHRFQNKPLDKRESGRQVKGWLV